MSDFLIANPLERLSAAERGRARFGLYVWIGFAIAFVVVVLTKPDLLVPVKGQHFAGRIVSEDITRWVVMSNEYRTEDASRIVRPGVVYIPKAEIAEVYRYGARSVTPEYHRAAMLWWKSQTMYTGGEHGFLYMPQSAMAYSPFSLLSPALEETLWRTLGIAAYAAGIWALCRRLFGARGGTAFLIASALAIPAALGSATNGQTNLHMAGLFALAAAAVMDRRWWPATLWLMLALACKPTSIVMVLLFGAIWWRPMSWRLAVGVAAFMAAPFLHPHPAYVLDQYREFVLKAARAGAPTDRFQDIRGMLDSFGMPEPQEKGAKDAVEMAFTGVRGLAAVLTLGMCVLAWVRSRPFAPVYVLALGAAFLMLFNPRTEGLSYVILGPAAALWATRELLARRWWTFGGLLVFCLAFQFSTQITLGEKNYWVRPLGTIGFAALVIFEIVRGRNFPSWLGSWYDASATAPARTEPSV